MSENTSGETSTQETGPASLSEALSQTLNEEFDAAEATENESTDSDQEQEAETTDENETLEADSESSDDEESQDDEEVIPAPEHWSDEDKATFTKLPEDARSYILKREKEYEQGIEKKTNEYKPLLDALQPYDAMLSLRGIDKATAVRNWAAAQAMLDRDPVEGIKLLAQSYGVDIAKKLADSFSSSSNTDDSESLDDPEISALKREIRELKQQHTQASLSNDTFQQQNVLDEINTFKQEQTEDGKPKHPHFDQVAMTMRALLTSGAAKDLSDAYGQAVWSVPEYREGFLKQQEAEAKAQTEKDRIAKAKKAKKAATSVQGKGSKPKESPKTVSLRDDLGAAWDEAIRGN